MLLWLKEPLYLMERAWVMLPIQGDEVEFTDYMMVKLAVVWAAALLYGLYMGFTGQ